MKVKLITSERSGSAAITILIREEKSTIIVTMKELGTLYIREV